jgi:hypothetical protein
MIPGSIVTYRGENLPTAPFGPPTHITIKRPNKRLGVAALTTTIDGKNAETRVFAPLQE